jgi:hypothetical protein
LQHGGLAHTGEHGRNIGPRLPFLCSRLREDCVLQQVVFNQAGERGLVG